MKKLLDLITQTMEEAFDGLGFEKSYARVTVSNRPDLCEFQCNGAMALAKQAKKAPIEIAEQIAEKLSGHLDEKIKEERAAVIKQISAEKFFAFQKSNIGDVVEVLIEKHPDKKTGLFKGITANYLNVIMPNGEFNTLKKVKITGLDGNRLLGEVVE